MSKRKPSRKSAQPPSYTNLFPNARIDAAVGAESQDPVLAEIHAILGPGGLDLEQIIDKDGKLAYKIPDGGITREMLEAKFDFPEDYDWSDFERGLQ